MAEPTMPEITDADLARFTAAAAAADDPERVMRAAGTAFADLHNLVCRGERVAAAGAAITVQDLCLQLCAAPAGSARASDDRRRFLAIIVRWAWARVPAVAGVLEANRQQEFERWGDGEGHKV